MKNLVYNLDIFNTILKKTILGEEQEKQFVIDGKYYNSSKYPFVKY